MFFLILPQGTSCCNLHQETSVNERWRKEPLLRISGTKNPQSAFVAPIALVRQTE